MTGPEEIRVQLGELKVIYQETRKRHLEWEALQDVEKAREAFLQAVAEDDALLVDLTRRLENLQGKRRPLNPTPRQQFPEQPIPFRNQPFKRGLSLRPDELSSGDKPNQMPELPAADEAALAIRRRLQKIVGRYAFRWQLTTEVVGRINRIACSDGPLGEALVLLEWSSFEQPLHQYETPEVHLARLKEWRAELAAYFDFLCGEITAERNRQFKSLDIWERWRNRSTGQVGRESWECFIADARQIRRQKIAEIEEKIADAQREMAEWSAASSASVSRILRNEGL